MRFNDFKQLNEAQFNSKQEVIDHFVKQGKSAAAGASAWERGWRGHTPKKKELKPAPRSYHDDLDDKRYGETNEDSDPCWKDYKQVGMKEKGGKQVPNCVPKESIDTLEQELAEAAIGVAAKRAARKGSRPARGHEPVPRYKNHTSPSGVETNMPPTDDDYEINYGKEGLVAKDRKARGVDVATGTQKVDEHKKGVRAHKYTKKPKGTVEATRKYMNSPHHKVIGPKEIQKLEKALHEARVEFNKKTARMEINNDDTDQRHGLYLNGKLVKTYSTKEQAENMKKRSPMYKDATIKKIAEGAKVDRMAKHIAKSERKLGHSKDEAENIAWATLNKRGMLNNKNKKKTVAETHDPAFQRMMGNITNKEKHHIFKVVDDYTKEVGYGVEDFAYDDIDILASERLGGMDLHELADIIGFVDPIDDAEENPHSKWAGNVIDRNDPRTWPKDDLEEEQFCPDCGGSLAEAGKASRSLCVSSKPDSELGASQLASCKSQGLRARDGEKSHKIGKTRTRVGGHKIRGKKYGGPLPDWS